MNRVLFVCLGNICRSPMAEAIFRYQVQEQGLLHRFDIDSAGTAAYHVGERPDHRTILTLKSRGIITEHLGRQATVADFHAYDWILAMDRSNLSNLQRLAPGNGKAQLALMRDFEPHPTHQGAEVPDPYYGDLNGFEEVFEMLERCCAEFLLRLNK